MGSCESSSDNIEAPKMIPSSIIAERKQLASSKHVFDIPKELEGELEVHTAVGIWLMI